LLKGSQPLAERKNNREVVTALREIADAQVVFAHPEYLRGIKEEYRPVLDHTEFVGDEEYTE